MATRGVNKVILVGNLGQDPEVRYMPNGGAVANITLATPETWRDKQTGENREVTEWHRVVLFGKLAEVAGEYLRKGSQVYIEGQLRTRKWQGTDGQEKYTTEIVVNVGGTLQMLGGRADNDRTTGHQNNHSHQTAEVQKAPVKGGARGNTSRGDKVVDQPAQHASQEQIPPKGSYPPAPDNYDDPIPF